MSEDVYEENRTLREALEELERLINELGTLPGVLTTQTGLLGRDPDTQLAEWQRRADYAAEDIRRTVSRARAALSESVHAARDGAAINARRTDAVTAADGLLCALLSGAPVTAGAIRRVRELLGEWCAESEERKT